MRSPSVTQRLIGHFASSTTHRRQQARTRLEAITVREREVLLAVGRGMANAEVGRALFLSEATIKAYVTQLVTKLDSTNRVQLAILAHDAGLL